MATASGVAPVSWSSKTCCAPRQAVHRPSGVSVCTRTTYCNASRRWRIRVLARDRCHGGLARDRCHGSHIFTVIGADCSTIADLSRIESIEFYGRLSFAGIAYRSL